MSVKSCAAAWALAFSALDIAKFYREAMKKSNGKGGKGLFWNH
jgi:hypothetical protein